MAKNYEYECYYCRMVVTTTNPYPPDKKAGGACTKDSNGNHFWKKTREYET